MRLTLIFSLIFLVVSCTKVNTKSDSYKVNFSKLKAILSDSNFNQAATISIKNIATCKIEFISHWSKEVSKRKGFYSVNTAVIVDFSDNYQDSAFTAAYDVIENDVVTQRWGDLVEINFQRAAEVRKITLEKASSDGVIKRYKTL